MSRSARLVLPWPPSANNAYPTLPNGKRILSRAGKSYLKAVNDQVTLQHVARHTLTGKLAVSIVARPPNNGKHDLDNLCKVPMDCLKKAGVIVEDSLIDDLRIRRGLVIKRGELEVQIDEIPGEATESAPLFAASSA